MIVISIAADPSVDIEATHDSLPLMPVIVDFFIVKPNQMMPPMFSVCGVYVWCVCVCVVCVHGVMCSMCVWCVCVVYVCVVVCVCGV